jgi:hypothetical protein
MSEIAKRFINREQKPLILPDGTVYSPVRRSLDVVLREKIASCIDPVRRDRIVALSHMAAWSGELSPSTAADIASLPPEWQLKAYLSYSGTIKFQSILDGIKR